MSREQENTARETFERLHGQLNNPPEELRHMDQHQRESFFSITKCQMKTILDKYLYGPEKEEAGKIIYNLPRIGCVHVRMQQMLQDKHTLQARRRCCGYGHRARGAPACYVLPRLSGLSGG